METWGIMEQIPYSTKLLTWMTCSLCETRGGLFSWEMSNNANGNESDDNGRPQQTAGDVPSHGLFRAILQGGDHDTVHLTDEGNEAQPLVEWWVCCRISG